VTDHRIKLSLYSLDRILGGEVGELTEALQADDIAERLRESGIS
jgi:peptide chain release factor 1